MSIRLGIIGCGLKAASYARTWTGSADAPQIVALTDTSGASIKRYSDIVVQSGADAPKVYGTAEALLAAEKDSIDAVYISTPHIYHQTYAKAALAAGLHVLLEKPMALTAQEAREILAARDAAGRTVVVAYQSSLSPLIASYRKRIAAGEFGELLAVSGEVWEHWQERYVGNWKQVPELSGGGFICDTGSHLFNAVLQATGRSYTQVAANLGNRGKNYELVGGVLARLDGDIPVTLSFCGDTTQGCESALTLYFENAIVKLDIWGKWAELRQGNQTIRNAGGEADGAVLDTFIKVIGGAPNPSSAEQSLHLAELWDLAKQSSEQNSAALALTTSI